MYPKGTLMLFSFMGSSAPRNSIRCPVFFRTSSRGDSRASQASAWPSLSNAQQYWANTLSRRVAPTFRITSACISGCCISSTGTIRLTAELLRLPRPPLRS